MTGPCRWLADQGKEWLAGINDDCIDLSGPDRSVLDMMLPAATQVADPFHVNHVAGLLVLLYAQHPPSRLTLDHVQVSGGEVRLLLGRAPLVLPEPLAALVLHLVATRRGHATIGEQGTSPWLLPGGRPGQPISSYHLAERLHQIGLQPGPARSAALFQLATELPAAVLARMLGIHIGAAAWQRASSGDWMTYAADVSRRSREGDL